MLSQCWQICLGLFLLKCLSFSDWLSSPLLSSQLTEAELHLVSLAVHMRGVTNYNTHQVGEMMADMASLLQTQEVGLAVRPTVALLNHSCCPNTVRASAGSQVVIMASATIPAGAEVTDIYSGTYYDMEKSARGAKCAEYEFTCACAACSDHWPLAHCLPGGLQDTPASGLRENVPRSGLHDKVFSILCTALSPVCPRESEEAI